MFIQFIVEMQRYKFYFAFVPNRNFRKTGIIIQNIINFDLELLKP